MKWLLIGYFLNAFVIGEFSTLSECEAHKITLIEKGGKANCLSREILDINVPKIYNDVMPPVYSPPLYYKLPNELPDFK
jgi:hypothetical protein